MSITDPALWTEHHLARLFGVEVSWITSELEAGRLPGIRAGKRWLCDPAEIEAELLKRARSKPNVDPTPEVALPAVKS